MAALAEETGICFYLPLAVELRAALAGLRGDAAARQRHLREAHRLFIHAGATGHARRLTKDIQDKADRGSYEGG